METEKTKEKFKSVHRTFVYTPKSSLTNQLSSLAFGIGMIVVPLLILPSGTLSTILIVGGALLLIMTLYSIRKARVLAAQGGSITIDKGRVTYPNIIRKSKFPQNPKRSVRFSGKRTKRSVQKRKARNTQKAETKVL